MKLARILQAASAAYPQMLSAWDEAAERPADRPGENPFARFVVSLLLSTYDASASDKKQLKTAADAIRRAIMDLELTCWSLCDAWVDAAIRERENR